MFHTIVYAFCQLLPALVSFFVTYGITGVPFDRREFYTFVWFKKFNSGHQFNFPHPKRGRRLMHWHLPSPVSKASSSQIFKTFQ